MDTINEKIKIADNNIIRNIELIDSEGIWLVSQNILSQIRNLLQAVFLKIYCSDENQTLELNYDNIEKATKYIHSEWKYKTFSKFYKFIQTSSSHYTESPENSERLIIKYIPFLYELKNFMKEEYDIVILQNLCKIVNNKDTYQQEYYNKIWEKIKNNKNLIHNKDLSRERFYIQKIKPFFVKNEIFYEITFNRASDNTSKFERIIAFTHLNILENYAVKFNIVNGEVNINHLTTPIYIITSWEISIRPCEFQNFWKIFWNDLKISSYTKWTLKFIEYLTNNKLNFVDIITLEESNYTNLKNKFKEYKDWNLSSFFEVLDKAYNIINNNKPGSVILRYLLFMMNNKIIKLQYNNSPNKLLSNLNLKYWVIPFDEMPFCTSLIWHNPKNLDLIECIDVNWREEEFFVKKVINNIEQKWILFTEKNNDKELELLKKYNDKLYREHLEERELVFKYDHFYLKWYVNTTIKILDYLQKFNKEWLQWYKDSVQFWLNDKKNDYIDDEWKKELLLKMFENSKISCIFWAAWTGKTTMLNFISDFFQQHKKIFLANTHPAVDNLKRRINNADDNNCKTIKNFLSSKNIDSECDILIIDESSTVSNRDMLEILEKVQTQSIILVWDFYQIKSIQFGNWFSLIKNWLFDPKSIYELKNVYRTNDNNLLNFWNKVRNMDNDIIEYIVKYNYSDILSDKIFEKFQENEIILCLNYDWFYWVNNINKILQANNPNEKIWWWTQIYKVGDPILFNEIANKRFNWILYNNLQWIIKEINKNNDEINFKIEVDIEIEPKNLLFQNDLKILEFLNWKTLVEFSVQKPISTDNDDENIRHEIPFQVSYAISIHKSQWLEYDSVKIIISDEIWEQISHNIFYTAITRARKDLKIYWSPKIQNSIIEKFSINNENKKNINLIKNIINKNS